MRTNRLQEALKAYETLQYTTPIDRRKKYASYELRTCYLCLSEVALNPVKGPFCIHAKWTKSTGCAAVLPVMLSGSMN